MATPQQTRRRTRTVSDSASSKAAEQVARGRSREEAPVKEHVALLSSGSTLLNLACTDNHRGAFAAGKVITLPGSSSAGKTILMLTSFAEAARNPDFAEYDLVYDDAEAANEFDVAKLFGRKTAERIQEPPNGISGTIQSFEANVLTLAKRGKPFIYAQDSFDSLTSDEELEKEMRKALASAKSDEAAKKIAGSYNTEKAKIAGQILRMVVRELKATGSILFLVQQLRQKINAGPFSSPYTTSGGEAPFFYSSWQVWLQKLESIKSKDRKVGAITRAQVRKNKYTGKLRDVEFGIRYDYGIDDIGSCVDFLLKEEFWKKTKQTIHAEGLALEATREKLIVEIEERGLENKLRLLTARAWAEIEDSIKTKRKPRY